MLRSLNPVSSFQAKKKSPLHDNAASLQFSDNARKHFDNQLLDLVITLLATLLLLLVLLLPLVTPCLSLLRILLLSTLVSTMLLPLALSTMLLPTAVIGHLGWSTLEVDVHASSILFRGILKAEFLAYLLDAWFDFLDVVDRVVALAYDTIPSSSALPLRRPAIVLHF